MIIYFMEVMNDKNSEMRISNCKSLGINYFCGISGGEKGARSMDHV